MKYTQEYRIYENDVDFRKMATLGTLLRYCQQIGAEDAGWSAGGCGVIRSSG